ncbi:MAG: flagellar biosynthetic protein FliO [Thermoleophilaceae bacterium]
MKRISVPAAAAALWCILCAPAFAAERGENAPLDLEQAQESASGGGGGLTRTIVGLAIVIGVIFGLHWVLKQVKSGREEKVSGDGLASLATLPLGPNRAVHVVRAGNEVLVLGATEHGISQLRVYGEEEALEGGLIADPSEPEVIEAAPARPQRRLLPALSPNATTSANGTNVLDTLRGWTVRR